MSPRVLIIDDERNIRRTFAMVLTAEGFTVDVAESGEVVRVKSAEDSEFHDRSIARRLGLVTGSVLCVPITAENR